MSRYSDFTLLTVDDNPHNLFALRTLLHEHTDVQIIEAGSGREAIDIAVNNPAIDLIMLDIQMPEMDGFETAELLKTRRRTRDIPIIFLTAAFKTDEFQQRGFAIGAVDYLLKPIDDNLLINKVSAYFRLIEKERGLNQQLERQVAERTAQLDASNKYLNGILSAMGEALLVLSPTGRIKQANPAAYAMLGYADGGLIDMGIGDVFEEGEDEQAEAFMGTWLEALIRTGAMRAIEARFIAADQRRVPVLFSRTAMTNEAGEITDILCIAKDMTGYVKLDTDN